MVEVKVDMTGWVMKEHGVPESRLTVVKQAEDYINPSGKHFACWECECSCGNPNHIIVGQYALKTSTLSCGCVYREAMKQMGINKHKANWYDLSGEYGIGQTYNTGALFYFDLDRYDDIKDICWREVIINGLHVLQGFDLKDRKTVTMHNYLGYKNHDHIDRNELNNRSNNLRPATQQENARNKSKPCNNTSGVMGVYWNKKFNKWQARVTTDAHKEKSLGYFVNKKDAVVARLEGELKYYGEFAPQRHLFEEYGINTIEEGEHNDG